MADGWQGLAPAAYSGTDTPGAGTMARYLPAGPRMDRFGSERLAGSLLDRLTHHVHILEMNGDSYRLKGSRENAALQAPEKPEDA